MRNNNNMILALRSLKERGHFKLFVRKSVGMTGAVKEEILARDLSDETRVVAPLRQASDAILIDTSESDTETVLNTILSKLPQL